MRKSDWIFVCLAVAFLFIGCRQEGSGPPEEKYFDSFPGTSDALTLTVFYPSVGTLRSLLTLREQRFLPTEGIVVVGVYHEKEVSDYRASREFVKENRMRWFQFHKITGEMDRRVLFQKNAWSPEFEKIFQKSDGMIFFGGADIPPSLYKDKTNLLTSIQTPYRHFMELSFIFHLLGGYQNNAFQGLLESRPEIPVLGICLGEQSLNVGSGGTLIQDIGSEIYGINYFEDAVDLGSENWHNNPWAKMYPEENLLRYTMHRIRLAGDGKFCSVLGFSPDATPYVVSSHHQAVKALGKGMRIIATSLDGKIPEAIEHERFPNVLGIQFHPEFPELYDKEGRYRITPHEEGKSLRSVLEEDPPSFAFHEKLWSWFVEAAKGCHKKNQF